jgi:hypothetical protein
MGSHFDLRIICAESDRLGGVNITFNDGSTALFTANLLYSLIPKAAEMDQIPLNIPRQTEFNGNLKTIC